jgi:hypothetical protein
MSRRTEPSRKRPLEVLADLLDGHREAAIRGPDAARKYLERVQSENKSLPNAAKFFLYDLLADALLKLGRAAEAGAAAATARSYIGEAEADAPRQWKEYAPTMRAFEVGIAAASDEGRFEDALAICEAAIARGLGRVYESKADSLRRMI